MTRTSFGRVPAWLSKGRTAHVPVINGRFLTGPESGVSRVGWELLRALTEELSGGELERPIHVAVFDLRPLVNAGVSSSLRYTRGLPGRLGEQMLPLLYPGGTFINFCNVTPLLAWRSVLWIHDAHILDAPETYPRAYRYWHHSMLQVARVRRFQIVTVSEFARSRLVHHGVDPALIRVIYNGGDHILRERENPAVLTRFGLDRHRFVLVVGSPARHKNVPFALETLIEHIDPAIMIAVVGMAQRGPYQSTTALVDHPRVVILPRVDDAELRTLYGAATSVIAPSLVEGFGLYAAEAMFAGSGPLVLSDRGALPEVGGAAALYFDPTNKLSLSEAVQKSLVPGIAEQLKSAAVIQREKYRWRRAAREVLSAFA